MKRGLLMALLLGLTGCVIGRTTDGVPLDASLLATLKPGKATAKEVTETLGAPQLVVELDKRSAYQYRFTKQASAGMALLVFNTFNQDTRYDRIWVFFDENDVLTHYGAAYRGANAKHAFPWTKLHPSEPKEESEPEPKPE